MQCLPIISLSRLFVITLTALSFNLLQAKAPYKKAKPVCAALAVEAESGKILYQHNASAFTPPASLTKIMTLLMLFDAMDQGKLRLTDMIPVSKYAASRAPGKLGLRPGSYISVQNIILALITKSANDAAAVAGELLGGSEANFAKLMTQRARQLGMVNTTFKNASGLPAAGQLTTARDMAVLGLVTLKHYQKYFHLFGVKEFCYNKTCHVNHNYRLLSQKELVFDGIKTGYVNASGFNVIASHKNEHGKRIIVVVMGGATSAMRDKRVVEIVRQLRPASPNVYVAKAAKPSLPKSVSANYNQIEASITGTQSLSPAGGNQYALLLGYYGSQLRAETVAKQALSHINLSNPKMVSTQRTRVGGRYLYQAQINSLSKEQVDQAVAILSYFNIDCSVVEQSS